MKYFHVLANQLQANKNLFTHFYNIPKEKQRQSSVAIIFRVNKQHDWSQLRSQVQKLYTNNPHPQNSVCPGPVLSQILQKTTDNDIEMLFAQRSTNEVDFNSGNVCFPGGKSDGMESDLQACIREVRQEVGITLLKQQSSYLNVYLGKFKHNFFYRQTRKEKVFISCHLFLILNPSVTMILNSAEIYETKWVNFSKLLAQPSYVYKSRQNVTALNSFPGPLKFLQRSVKNNLQYIQYSAIDVQLGGPLWGLSLNLYLHMLRIISNKLPSSQSKLLQQRIKSSEMFEAKFNWYYPLKYPCEWFVKSWNKKNRINAFKQPPVKQSMFKSLGYIGVLILLVWLFKLYFNF